MNVKTIDYLVKYKPLIVKFTRSSKFLKFARDYQMASALKQDAILATVDNWPDEIVNNLFNLIGDNLNKLSYINRNQILTDAIQHIDVIAHTLVLHTEPTPFLMRVTDVNIPVSINVETLLADDDFMRGYVLHGLEIYFDKTFSQNYELIKFEDFNF